MVVVMLVGLVGSCLTANSPPVNTGHQNPNPNKLYDALYGSNPDIVHLSEADFDEIVFRSDSPWLVQVYTPWCKYSKEFAPEYNRLANELASSNSGIKVGVLHGDNNKKLKDRLGVIGFPTVKFFLPEVSRRVGERSDFRSQGGAPGKKMYTYQGQRTVQDVSDFVFSLLSPKRKTHHRSPSHDNVRRR